MGAVTDVLLPEVAVFRRADSKTRKLLFWILGATAVFSIGVCVAVFMILGHESKLARHGAQQFGAALVANSGSAAPAGAAGYVAGVRAYFGPVTSARVIGTHNKSINGPDSVDDRSYYVAALWIDSRRGPAVLQVEFDNHALSNDEISSVHELEPGHTRGLSAAQRAQLEEAFAARGGAAADAAVLSAAFSHVTAPAVHVTKVDAAKTTARVTKVHVAKPHIAIPTQLRCVQQAHHDVAKLARCAR
jgi:hypothetical protein